MVFNQDKYKYFISSYFMFVEPFRVKQIKKTSKTKKTFSYLECNSKLKPELIMVLGRRSTKKKLEFWVWVLISTQTKTQKLKTKQIPNPSPKPKKTKAP